MYRPNRFPRRPLAALTLAILLAGCATDQALREGEALIDQGRYEEGLARLNEAVTQAPNEPRYRSSLALQHDRVVVTLLARAERLRQTGDYAGATATYQRVLALDERNSRAIDALRVLEQRRHLEDMLKQARNAFRRGDVELAEKQLASVLALDPTSGDALSLRREIDQQHARTDSTYPRLRSRYTKPVTLEFRDAPLRMVLDALARSTGLNFIVDREVKPDIKVTIFVRQVALDDALDLLLSQSQLEKKLVNDNTVLVYPSTPAKVREYQDWVIRTFFVTNMDVKQAQTLIKTMLKTKDLFIDEKLNALTMRDTPDAVRLAEKLLQAQDQADAEVVLEVELLDISRDRFLDLGITWPSTFTVLAPGGAAATLLSQLRGGLEAERLGIDRSVQLRAKSLNNDVNTLASPRIRVRNRDKARIHIGDRIPVVNATSTPSTQGPVITETVQYLDTGIKLEVEPTVYQSDEVGIKLTLEVSDSQDAGRTNSGTTLVRVKTTNAQTSLRLKNGETQILAGLLRSDHTANADQIPGLGEIPAAGRLFGQHDDDYKKRELVLSITPRIVRNTPYLPPFQLEYGSGTEGSLRSRPLMLQGSEPAGEALTLTAPPGSPGPGVGPSAGRPTSPQTSPQTTTAPSFGRGRPPTVQPITPVPEPVPPAGPAVGSPASPTVGVPSVPAPVAGVPVTVAFDGVTHLKVGEEGAVTLLVKADQPLVSTALQIAFDPKVLKVLEVTEGPMLREDGTNTNFSARNDESAGRLFIGISREGDNGATGEAALVQLRVAGVAPGPAALKLIVFSGMGPGNTVESATLPPGLDLVVEP
jgi:general secretion pathway protein D